MSELAAMPTELLGLADWEALPEDELHHIELVEGTLTVAPKPIPFHSSAVGELIVLLCGAVPETVKVLGAVDVVLESSTPATVRAPDVVVVDRAAFRSGGKNIAAANVWLAVEIVSPGSRRADYVAKRYDYEQAGIGFYWIIDLEQHRVTCLELAQLDGAQSGGYVERPVDNGDRVRLPAPYPIEFSWDDLIS